MTKGFGILVVLGVAVVVSGCTSSICSRLDSVMTSEADSCGGSPPTKSQRDQCDQGIEKCNDEDKTNLKKYADCLEAISCDADGGSPTGSKLGCLISTPTVSDACLTAIQGNATDNESSTAETQACLKGWWIESTFGCSCEGSSTPLPECAGGDCNGLMVRGYGEDGSTWWSFGVATSAKLHSMTTWGVGEKGSFSVQGADISFTGGDGRKFDQHVSKCDAQHNTVEYIVETKASAAASASFAAAVKQYGDKTSYSWKSASYNP